MAKRKALESTEDPVGTAVQEGADNARQAGDEAPETNGRKGFRERVQPKLPSKITIPVGDALVNYITDSNEGGVGLQVKFRDGRKPNEKELEIIQKHIKDDEGARTEFNWDYKTNSRRKPIGKDAPSNVAMAIRYDAEGRAEALADELREYFKDPATFAERVQQKREEQTTGKEIPF
jgi:hypothetical protein